MVFVVKYLDQFVAGSVLGPVALGYYVLAFNLSNWPVSVLSQPVRQVSPAAFARLQGDPTALRGAFISSIGLLAAVTMPVCLVLSGAADPIISFVYGASWAPAAAALVWLGLFASLRILFELIYDYFVVIGNTRVVFTVQVIWSLALIPALVAGTMIAGIAGAALANVVVAMAVVLPLYLLELHKAQIAWLVTRQRRRRPCRRRGWGGGRLAHRRARDHDRHRRAADRRPGGGGRPRPGSLAHSSHRHAAAQRDPDSSRVTIHTAAIEEPPQT